MQPGIRRQKNAPNRYWEENAMSASSFTLLRAAAATASMIAVASATAAHAQERADIPTVFEER